MGASFFELFPNWKQLPKLWEGAENRENPYHQGVKNTEKGGKRHGENI